MIEKVYISWDEIFFRLQAIDKIGNTVYGIPKGGMIATAFLRQANVTHNPKYANIILDDILDSGATFQKYQHLLSKDVQFFPLFDKKNESWIHGKWVVFPWEADHPAGEENIQQNLTRILQYIGEDPQREGLVDTPNRIVRSWNELYAGYTVDMNSLFTTFESNGYDEIVLLKNFEFYSMCEHHMLPFFGKAHVAYIPRKRVIGISKLARITDAFARRLQIQERLGQQIVDTLIEHLDPLGAACILEASHLCMRMRGANKQNSIMTTSVMKGVFMEKQQAREELMQLIRS